MTDQNPETSPVSTTEITSCSGCAMALRRSWQWLSNLAIWRNLPCRNLDTTATGYDCAICLQATSQEENCSLECNHQFHWDCVLTWIIDNGSCPVCFEECAIAYKFPYIDITEFNNPGINMSFLPNGIDVSRDGRPFMRLCNIDIHETSTMREGFIDIKLEDGSSIKFNNISDYSIEEGSLIIKDGTIKVMLMNGWVLRDSDGVLLFLDNGSFINPNGAKVTMKSAE